jgi:hypothetical protein
MEGIRNKVLLNPAILSRTTGYSGFVRGSRLYLLNVGGLNMGGSERETRSQSEDLHCRQD